MAMVSFNFVAPLFRNTSQHLRIGARADARRLSRILALARGPELTREIVTSRVSSGSKIGSRANILDPELTREVAIHLALVRERIGEK